MTNEQAIKYLISPIATSTEPSAEYLKQKEAYEIAIKALEFIEENFPNSFIDYLGDIEVSPTEYFKAKHGIEFRIEKGSGE